MTSANPPIPAPAPRRELEPTHACIRCGREGVPADAGLCELCNPLELSQPAATQMHGIAAVGIIAFIVVLAVLGRVALSGTGPFTGELVGVHPVPGGLAVTISITNEGAKPAATTCLVTELPRRAGGPTQVVQSPLVGAYSTLRFTAVIDKLGPEVIDLAADCTRQ